MKINGICELYIVIGFLWLVDKKYVFLYYFGVFFLCFLMDLGIKRGKENFIFLVYIYLYFIIDVGMNS